jgi:import inner membrane translocase subunit TIM23
MAIFGSLFGSPTPATNESGPSDHTTSADLFNSTTFSSNVQPKSGNQSASGLPLPPSSSPPPLPAAPTAADMFSTSAYDPAKLHPLAGLDKMDFLQLDEDKLSDVQGAATVLPSRGWTDDLCIGTGTTYLSGKLEYTRFRGSELMTQDLD